MADSQDPAGGKRKFNENPLTAKAETGSLKIKIMRKGEMMMGGGALLSSSGGGTMDGGGYSAPRSPVNVQVQSPPKPRPNRKHVPIFYQRPNAFDVSTTSSTDENFTQVSSVSSDYDAVNNVSTASTSSAAGRFARLDLSRENSGSGGFLGDLLPPPGNPLFSRGNSETGGMLTDLLKHAFPPTLSAENSYEYSESSSMSAQESDSMSQSSLLNPAAALRQLASSSAVFSMESRDFSYAHVLAPPPPPHVEARVQHPSDEDSKPYQFDPMSALQDAVKMAVATTSPSASSSSFGRLPEASENDDEADLGPPPSAPPAFAVEHSLMGGGIEAQPNIASVNTVNFDWTRHQRQAALNRAKAGSLANVAEDGGVVHNPQHT